MEFLVPVLFLAAGIALLGFGADVLVRGAVGLATLARVSSAVIGLTIVAMGTSLPELTVGVAASLKGASDIGVGNVVGVNVFNVCVVLGISALILPMRVHGAAVRLEWPFMFLASFILFLLARDGTLDRVEGAFFVVSLGLFVAYVVRIGRKDVQGEEKADLQELIELKTFGDRLRRMGPALGLIGGGIAVLIVGGEVLMRGALSLAHSAGMSERMIGLTVVAFGTGTPEVATAIVAARRGQSELALGNVIGSNIVNILGILGVTALIRPLALDPAAVNHDIPWMLGFSLVLLPIMRRGSVIDRSEGALLLVAYVGYLVLLALGY
ncbi:MAG: calcium/sodium antiporter [Gemmatimonadaceae bacterium]|nr:calcium/sodium antiporter [Gemmatimonadaceae bacterium]MCW5825807.1 calcium/sodium antiporter [Gemmatimonadaceae bacterium]